MKQQYTVRCYIQNWNWVNTHVLYNPNVKDYWTKKSRRQECKASTNKIRRRAVPLTKAYGQKGDDSSGAHLMTLKVTEVGMKDQSWWKEARPAVWHAVCCDAIGIQGMLHYNACETWNKEIRPELNFQAKKDTVNP